MHYPYYIVIVLYHNHKSTHNTLPGYLFITPAYQTRRQNTHPKLSHPSTKTISDEQINQSQAKPRLSCRSLAHILYST